MEQNQENREEIKVAVQQSLKEYISLSWLAIYTDLYRKKFVVTTDHLYEIMKELIDEGIVETKIHSNTRFYNITGVTLSE